MKIKLILLCVIFLTASVDASVAVAPDDANILYTGRWDQSNTSQPWARAKGTSIIANFQGTGLSATFSASTTEYLRIIIDGQAAVSRKIPISSSSVTYELASGLSEGNHKIEIVKETDASRLTFHGFELDTGAVLLAPPARPERKLVFYGDSNLAGYSLEHEQNQSGRNLQGSYYGYAGIVSRMLGAEYSNISRSGASIKTLHASYDLIEWGNPGSSWNFNKFRPDAVVINIGANDVGRPKRKIKKDYRALLDDMRVSYPDAHIMLYNAWGWDYDEPANYIDEVIAARNDNNMSYATFPWIFEQWHGCEYDHSGMAHVLAAHLKEIPDLEWEEFPAGVMNGYGTDGNVANGGFEEIAPFGGFGWRYYEDQDVSRVSDSGDAHGGSSFLRLSNGAPAHQPNPAIEGETFSVAVWMRGSSEGSQVEMTIDFRDQEMWTDPLQSFPKTIDLTTVWAPYEMSATAPTGTARPVFHTRLTFRAAVGSTVDIDDVVMSLGVVSDVCTDGDDDGFGNPGDGSCPAGPKTDCIDSDPDVNPDAGEFCDNGIDDNCNFLVDDDDPACQTWCAEFGDSCTTGSDCCSGNCSKGKPSRRRCQ